MTAGGAAGGAATIEAATWRDLNALRSMEKVCFPKDGWPLWDLIGVLTLGNIVRLKAVDGETMVGFIAGEERPDNHQTAWIITVAVLPEFRRRGIGEALVVECQRRFEMQRVRLSVRASNEGAIRLYRRLGYQHVELWPKYYSDHEDAIVMEINRMGGGG